MQLSNVSVPCMHGCLKIIKAPCILPYCYACLVILPYCYACLVIQCGYSHHQVVLLAIYLFSFDHHRRNTKNNSHFRKMCGSTVAFSNR